MKRIILNKKQVNRLNESILTNDNKSLISNLKEEVKNNDTPLSSIPCYDLFIDKVLDNSFNEAVNLFDEDITKISNEKIVNKLNELILKCQKKERKNKLFFEKLCYDLISVSFNNLINELDSDIELQCKLTNEIQYDDNVININKDYEFNDTNSIEVLKNEKTRRNIINTLNMGASLNLTDILLKEALHDIFDIDEELPHLYNSIIKLNSYLGFFSKQEKEDTNKTRAAYNNIEVSQDKIKITCEGIIFPFLLTETIRAFLNIPTLESLNNNEANELILKECDTNENERWNMLLGRYIWGLTTQNGKITPNKFGFYFKELMKIDLNDFIKLFSELLVGTKLGKEKIGELNNIIDWNFDYDLFIKNLDKKREEKSIIDDEKLSEDDFLNLC